MGKNIHEQICSNRYNSHFLVSLIFLMKIFGILTLIVVSAVGIVLALLIEWHTTKGKKREQFFD